MRTYERYLTALHMLVGAIVIGFSINNDDGALILGMFTACFLALVLFEKILVRFLVATAAVFVPMLTWGIWLIKTDPLVVMSKEYQEHGVLAFADFFFGAVVAGISTALVGILFHKAKRYFVMKYHSHKKPLISPIWLFLFTGWILVLILFYTWAILTRHDFHQYIPSLNTSVNTFALPIIAGVSGLVLYIVLILVRVSHVQEQKW